MRHVGASLHPSADPSGCTLQYEQRMNPYLGEDPILSSGVKLILHGPVSRPAVVRPAGTPIGEASTRYCQKDCEDFKDFGPRGDQLSRSITNQRAQQTIISGCTSVFLYESLGYWWFCEFTFVGLP